MQRRYWWYRGGAQRHKWNSIRRQRMAEKAKRSQRRKGLWRAYGPGAARVVCSSAASWCGVGSIRGDGSPCAQRCL